MTQSSVAVSVDGVAWALLNTSPDIGEQLIATPALHPKGLRDSPIAAVLLTNGDIDHVAGLLTLREKTPFRVHATAAGMEILEGNAVFGVLDRDLVGRELITLDTPFAPLPGLTVMAFAVPGKVALYLEGEAPELDALGEQTVGLRLQAGGRVAYYIPGCATVPDWLVERLGDADLLLFDGTVWENDEMARTGTGQKTGRRMGHIAMAGPEGSLARLAPLACRKIYIHINNTNPVLQPASAERAKLEEAGWTLARDGMELTA